MRARLALAAALALGACHRRPADVTLDADQDARNATQAKIDADLAAADAAARAPIPRPLPSPAPAVRRSEAPADENDLPSAPASDTNAED